MFHCCSSNQVVVEMKLEMKRERDRDGDWIQMEVAVLDCTHRISLPVSNANCNGLIGSGSLFFDNLFVLSRR